jgi:hypothetical protein
MNGLSFIQRTFDFEINHHLEMGKLLIKKFGIENAEQNLWMNSTSSRT